MRADALRNLERIRVAASEVFDERGLDAPLEEIARRAGVSVGTIYHRFGSREGLIDAVLADIAAQKLDAAIASVAGATPWERFSSYVIALAESQAADPTFNEVFARRFPEADALQDVNRRAVEYGRQLMTAAQADSQLRSDLTSADLDRLIWLNAQSISLGGDWWRRGLQFLLDGLEASK
ncbi:TetR/AcrR family transcriptional regulator [Nocardia sp. NPDC050793]|uniref:TetR/AcrR family transcriptional regulator n=1 Tax=Nocardia sp. NPDC050793 TaxID=3155159 RepID=UPI0033D76B70